MPTEYTHNLIEGVPEPLRDYMLRVAKHQFPGLDTSALPDAFIVPSSKGESIARKREELKEVKRISPSEWTRQATRSHQDSERQRQDNLERAKAIQSRVKDRIAEIERWKPPTKDHKPFKTSLLEDLNRTLWHEAGTADYETPNSPLTGEELRAEVIRRLENNLQSLTQGLREEQTQVRRANKWLAQLRDSLPRS